MADDKVIIDIQLNDGQVKNVFNSLTKSAKESSKEASSNLDSFLGGSFTKLVGTAAAAGAAIGAALFSKASVQAAMEAEAGVQRLNQSLANAGRFSLEASQSFQDFATEIQRTTTLDDDAVLSIAALANNFAKSTVQAQNLTKAAIELSAATGKDLNTSVQILGKTLSGSTGLLSKELPILQGFTKEQLKAGAAIDAVLNKFSTSAASQVNTFSGALLQAKNNFNSLQEEIGNFIVKDKVFVALLKGISEAFASAASSVAKFRTEGEGSTSFLGNMIILSVKVFEAVNKYLIAPLEVFVNLVGVVGRTIMTTITAVAAGFVNLANKFTSLLPDIGPFKQFKENIQADANSINNELSTQFDELASSVDNSLNMKVSGSTALFLEDLRYKLENAKDVSADFKNNVISDSQSISYELLNLQSAFTSVSEGASQAMLDLRINAEKNFKAAGAAMVQGMGQAAGNAFAAFGKAIATGQDAMQSFINSLLASIGQASIQLGTNFILQGIAYMWAGLPNGGALIAAGAGLAAFGGLLAGMGGGAGGSATAPTPGTPGGSPVITSPMTETPIDQTVEDRGPQNDVTVNIRGDVLDSDETGLRIVDIINTAFDKQGVVIKRGVTA